MKEHEFRTLENHLRSLRESTYLRLQRDALVCVLDRRCSPYVSRRSVEYSIADAGGLPEGAVVIANKARSVVLLTGHMALEGLERWVRMDEYECELVGASIPTALLGELRWELWRRLRVQLDQLCEVVFPVPAVDGWDEEGRPILRRVAEAS